MMAIVCKTYESVKALELYDAESKIIRTSGIHGAGASNGRPLDGRFLVICLENLRYDSHSHDLFCVLSFANLHSQLAA